MTVDEPPIPDNSFCLPRRVLSKANANSWLRAQLHCGATTERRYYQGTRGRFEYRGLFTISNHRGENLLNRRPPATGEASKLGSCTTYRDNGVYVKWHTATVRRRPLQDISRPLQVNWARHATEGLLHFLHESDIFHCDVNPHNFVLDISLNLKIANFSGS